MGELASCAAELNPDLILICESWCREDISDAFLQLPGYELIPDLRKDREDTVNGVGGGLLVYAKHGLTILSFDSGCNFNQHCSFKVVTGPEQISITLLYRPPSAGPDSIGGICELIRTCTGKNIFIGDFNLPGINWDTFQAAGRATDLVETCSDNFFEQLVNFPTHIKGNKLDLILTNVPGMLSDIEDMGRLGRSDHVMLLMKLETSARGAPTEQMVPNWRRADWDGLKKCVGEADMVEKMEAASAEQAWNILKSSILSAVEKNVPLKPRRTSNKPSWMTRGIIRALRRKRRIWRKERTCNESQEYKDAEKKVRNLIRNAKRSYERKLAEEAKSNSRPFYAYLKRKTKTKVTVGPLKNAEGQTVAGNKEMADLLNGYFKSVFSREPAFDSTAGPAPITEAKLVDFNITEEKIKSKLSKLRPTSAPGPDGIGAGLLQELQDQVIPALKILFRKLLDEKYTPEDWKQANVAPIFKKGAKSDPANYRPVSLTSVCCKIFESLIRDEIVRHLEVNNLLAGSQHGFVSSRSCATNLVEFFDAVTEAVDGGDSMDIIFLDFAKAFDKVPIRRLMAKLKAHGIEGKVWHWIESWLTGRRQRVVLNGSKSAWEEVLSGVPQGSVLGPILFTIFINDIDGAAVLTDILRKFADDTKLGKIIRSQEDVAALQGTLLNLERWAEQWCMSFNVKKCKVMHVGKNNTKQAYTMGGQILAATAEERDIGVQITENLKPAAQCSKAARTATVVLGQIAHAFHYRDKNTFMRLYKQYVRPHLEFASQAWNPWHQKDIDILEKVQQKAVGMVGGLKGRTYEDRLKELGLQSLVERRREADMTMVFKVISDKISVNKGAWFKLAGHTAQQLTRAAADPLRLLKPRARLDVREKFFNVRVIDQWNALPQGVRTAPTVARFRTALRRHAGASVPGQA